MYNDDYMNNFGSSGETPPEDNSTDTGEQQSAPLEPDKVYSAPHEPGQDSRTQAPYNNQPEQNGYAQPPYNSGSYTQPQPEKKKKKMSAKKKGVAIFAAILAAVVAVSAIVTVFAKSGNSGGAGNGTSITETSEGDAELNITDTPKATTTSKTGSTLTSAEVYAKVSPSNVGIVVYSQSSSSASGEGSGIVMGENKDHTCTYIITCAHVISGEGVKAVVQLHDGKQYDAEIVGTDEMNDVALLKIEAEGLQTVTVGDSDEVKVGETVEAIGNPLGDLTFTMTAGYISALDREIDADGTPINMLQTDAAINSGNSGGPLFDMNGNIIGVTTAKVSGTTETGVTIEGLGFAIPINDVLRVVYDLQQYGRVRGRAYLGVTLQNLDAEVAEIYGLPSGPQVVTVTEGSCSEKAGLQPHDIILEFDGREINAYSDLVSALSKHRAGDTVKLKLYRAGAEIEVTLTLDERPGEEEINEAEQQAQNELEGQSGQEEEFTVPDFDGYGYDYGG